MFSVSRELKCRRRVGACFQRNSWLSAIHALSALMASPDGVRRYPSHAISPRLDLPKLIAFSDPGELRSVLNRVALARVGLAGCGGIECVAHVRSVAELSALLNTSDGEAVRKATAVALEVVKEAHDCTLWQNVPMMQKMPVSSNSRGRPLWVIGIEI